MIKLGIFLIIICSLGFIIHKSPPYTTIRSVQGDGYVEMKMDGHCIELYEKHFEKCKD
jgi:hypothetical protein